MGSSWQEEKGHLALHWSDAGHRIEYSLRWMQEASEIKGSYLPPVPDFTSHSPFGGATWIYPTPLAVLPHKGVHL